MSVEIKTSIDGLTLETKNKFVKDDITISVDIPRYYGQYLEEILDGDDTLPEGYSLLNYIEGTGTQYIDTGYNMNVNNEIEMRITPTAYESSFKMGFLGSYTSTTQYQLYASGTNNQYFYSTFGGKTYIQTTKYYTNTTYKISMNLESILINGTEYEYAVEGTNDSDRPLYLFFRNETGGKAKMKLYYLKIYESNELVRDFLPCLRLNDNVVGLYEKVENKFYENIGTGEFIGG